MNPPSLRFRLAFTGCAISFACALLYAGWDRVGIGSDFDLQVHAANALLAGENPYETVGPHNPARYFPFGYYYPLPAAFFALPFLWLPVDAIGVLFVLATMGTLAWVASRDRLLYAPMLLSGPVFHAVQIGQWSMLLTAALMTPALVWTSAVKPNFAFAFQAARLEKSYLWGLLPAVVLAILALFVLPSWPLDWMATVRAAPAGMHTPIVKAPGGFLLLLALLRWRTFEGRLLTGLSVIPQTAFLYDPLPLFLVAKTRYQMWGLWLCSLVTMFVQDAITRSYSPDGSVHADQFAEYFVLFRADISSALVWTMYLPALAIVLWNGWKGPSRLHHILPIPYVERSRDRP